MWQTLGTAPEEMERVATAVDGRTVYVSPGYSHRLWAYDLTENKWTGLPDCPQQGAGLAVVSGLLTAVGGETNDGHATNTLVSLTESRSEWTEHFSPMPMKAYEPAVVCTDNHLVVVANMETSVHVMDATSLMWFSSSSLPWLLVNPSLVLCGTELFVLSYSFVFSCSLPALLHSSSAVQPDTTDVWQSVADVPVDNSTPTTLCGQLVAMGGHNVELEPVDTIHLYNPSMDSWHIIGYMPTARYDCIIAALPGDTLVVIGGVIREGTTGRLCDLVEVAYPV